MRRYALLLGSVALMASVTLPAAADSGRHHKATCGKTTRDGYAVIYDGSKRCFERWRYAGGASITRQRDGTLRTGPGAPGLGVLWYAARPYGDFDLKLQLRDDAPAADARANSGVQVRFPAPHPPVPGCPTTFNGVEQNNAAWIAVNCGHEIQVNDSPDGPPFDPRKTGSIYGFADLDSAHSHPVPKGVWYDLEIRVVNQHYTVIRDGQVINEFENVPGLTLGDRVNDPPSEARGLVGYVGLQSHGGPNDVVSFRNVRIKDLSDRD
jgi:hypothetical protein